MIGILAIAVALLLIYLTYRGLSLLILAPLLAQIGAPSGATAAIPA